MRRFFLYAALLFLLAGLILLFFAKASASYCLTGAFLEDMPTARDIENFRSQYGKKPFLTMVFVDWDNFVAKSVIRDVYSAECILFVTWEPWNALSREGINYERLLKGDYDAYIKRFAGELKSIEKTVFLRFAHEMNGNWYPWSGVRIGRDKYIACYRYVKDIFDTQGVVNVKWVFSVNWEDVPKEKNNFLLYYPGDNYVAYVGIDGYNWGTTKAWSRWMTFRGIFARRYKEIINDIHKPVIITEFGSASKGGDKAVWIRDAMAEIKRMREIKAFVLFNVDKETDWRFPASSRAGRELKKVLADEYFRDTGMLLK